jgi:hypothetical protein
MELVRSEDLQQSASIFPTSEGPEMIRVIEAQLEPSRFESRPSLGLSLSRHGGRKLERRRTDQCVPDGIRLLSREGLCA